MSGPSHSQSFVGNAPGRFDSLSQQPHGPTSKLDISIECYELADLDIGSKSDPQCYVFLKDANDKKFRKVGKTEMIRDTLKPKFATSIPVDYHFEEVQKLRFVVVDVDKPRGGVDQQQLIGETTVTIGDIVGSKGGRLTKKLVHNRRKKNGFIIISAEEQSALKVNLRFLLSGADLDKKDTFGKSDPYMQISRANSSGSYTVVHRTEYIRKTLHPKWREFEIPASKLCGGDFTRTLLFQCYDWNRSGNPDYIGEFKASINDLKKKTKHALINAKKQRKRKYKNSGVITFHKMDFIQQHSFLDFIVGGCQINLVVAIDYTASNGDPRYANSLHYRNPYEPNEYAKAILAVGDILAAYDNDQMIPTYGFGAKLPNGKVSHCFPINFNDSKPEVHGVKGVLDAYHASLDHVKLYGPTNFAEIIKRAASEAKEYDAVKEIQQYVILLIVTDGEITDMAKTVKEIVGASYLPLSIVIVGVGGADFSKMDALDADDSLLRSGSRVAERDIVQFVPFRKYKNQHFSRLAADTLAEVPGQLTSYMKKHHIKPLPAPSAQELQNIQQQQLSRERSSYVPGPNAPVGQGANYYQIPGQGPPPQQFRAQNPPQQGQGYSTGPTIGGTPGYAQPQQAPQGYPSQAGPYPPQGQGYPPQGAAQGQGYPPQGAPQGYPPQGQGAPSYQQGQGYPPQGAAQGQGYPPQGAPQGYPPQGQGYPPKQ